MNRSTTGKQLSITLQPTGRVLSLEAGASLQDVLFAQGVEFPCGGRGRCKGCRVKALTGDLPITAEDARSLPLLDLENGWRLACQAVPKANLALELAQWETAILADNSVFSFTAREGFGVSIDLGTTTVVAQLLDLRTGCVLGVHSALNAQARHGADIMSRIDFAIHENGAVTLRQLIRDQIHGMILDLAAAAKLEPSMLESIVLAGNTVMEHFFCGVDVEPLSRHPFEPVHTGPGDFEGNDLGWTAFGKTRVVFLPPLGSFVGSDLLAGLLATQIHENAALSILVDLGTNGELVLGNRDRLLCASTAAGPAFEGARISCGMRAATGAISEVTLRDGALQCRSIGGGPPRGLCGSGLVDAAACALELNLLKTNGTLGSGTSLALAPTIALMQADIRELQLAKGAIAAGIRVLLQQWGATAEDVERVWLAGAFGNYINRASARRIGLLDFPPEKVQPAGNTALLGAKIALFELPIQAGAYEKLRSRVRHVSLHEHPDFMGLYVDEMGFPASA